MMPTTQVQFALALFFGLASLLRWTVRREIAAKRLTRGLRGYVTACVN